MYVCTFMYSEQADPNLRMQGDVKRNDTVCAFKVTNYVGVQKCVRSLVQFDADRWQLEAELSM